MLLNTTSKQGKLVVAKSGGNANPSLALLSLQGLETTHLLPDTIWPLGKLGTSKNWSAYVVQFPSEKICRWD